MKRSALYAAVFGMVALAATAARSEPLRCEKQQFSKLGEMLAIVLMFPEGIADPADSTKINPRFLENLTGFYKGALSPKGDVVCLPDVANSPEFKTGMADAKRFFRANPKHPYTRFCTVWMGEAERLLAIEPKTPGDLAERMARLTGVDRFCANREP